LPLVVPARSHSSLKINLSDEPSPLPTQKPFCGSVIELHLSNGNRPRYSLSAVANFTKDTNAEAFINSFIADFIVYIIYDWFKTATITDYSISITATFLV